MDKQVIHSFLLPSTQNHLSIIFYAFLLNFDLHQTIPFFWCILKQKIKYL